MIKNYFKIAWRNLWKNKLFSFINILGLALGMACSLLIMLWVQSETSTDKFHKNDDRLYRVMGNQLYSGEINTYPSAPGLLAENLVKDFPEIEKASQILWEERPLFRVGEVFEKERGRYVQDDFLNMFSFKLEKGDPKTVLSRPESIIISKAVARKYFKNEDPIGKNIRIDNTKDATVTGILAEIPANSSLKFDFLMNYARWQKENEWSMDWSNNGPRCYVMLSKNADVDKVNAKIKDYIKTKNEGSNVELFLQNYGDSYLYSNWDGGVQDGGRIEYVCIFSIVAIFILLIACVNFMNLATARSVKRAKEVGVRKVVGAARSLLAGQFIGESILIASLGLIFALMIVILALPGFNSLTEKALSLRFTDPAFVATLVGLTLFTGIVAGSYPALFMSSLNPVVVLKGALKFKPSATFFRQGLVVCQFGLSIMLILGMIVVDRQLNYIQHKNVGYERENLIYVAIEGDLTENFPTFKQELLNSAGIKSVTASQADPLEVGSSTQGVTWPGKDTTQVMLFAQNPVSYDYIETMGIKLLAGRDLSKNYGTDSASYLVNEAAARKMGFGDPVGKEITFWAEKGKIIGLMKDYHHASLHQAIDPLIVRLFPPSERQWGYVLVRTQPGQTKQALAKLEATYKKFNPNFPFKYQFTDQEFALYYRSETTISTLSNYFAFLAIFISCLGLFGLAAFTAEQRTKEIGIRKALGASVNGLVAMLSKEFIVLVLISSVIAFPIAYYFLQDWLDNYEYSIKMEWWFFAVAAIAAVVIAVLTVGYQAIKTATVNPVKSLRSE